jgi:chaperonin GroES
MSLKPLNDRVLVRRLEGEEKTSGGIIIPDSAKEKPQRGEVMAAGPGKSDKDGNLVPMTVKKGDKVLFAKYAGTEFKMDGVEYLIMREDDILAVIE